MRFVVYVFQNLNAWKGIYKMSLKILQLYLVLVLTFKEFVEFSLSSAIVKIAVTNKTSIKQYFDSNLLLWLKQQKRQEQNFLIWKCQYDF